MNGNTAVPAELRACFCAHPKVALAFSGGCDSAYLLYAALECGAKVGVYYVYSEFQPRFELEDACSLARQLGSGLRIIAMDVLQERHVQENPANRCYYCKSAILGAIQDAAVKDGYTVLIDGTNASDKACDRPGMRALRELNVLSPLQMCGVTKEQVRSLSRLAGLFTWNKPAYACLATRIPTGMPIQKQMLERIERAENRLSEMGFADFRVRVTEEGARLEICENQLELLMEKRRAVISALEEDFHQICLDLRLRREKET